MKKIKFLNTELSVAPLCLGTVNYGSAMPEKEAIHPVSYTHLTTWSFAKAWG